MKRSNPILCIAALSLLSACASPRVFHLGRKPIRIEAEKLVTASDGSVALQASLVKRKGYFIRYVLVNEPSTKAGLLTNAPYNRDLPVSVGFKNNSALQLIPPDVRNINATLADLPPAFSSIRSVNSYYEGVHANATSKRPPFSLQFVPQVYERSWWSYPCQILLIPAIGIDIAIIPVIFVMWTFGELVSGGHH